MEKYLAKCIGSILSQTYVDIELILIDDGSTDKSSQICDKYADEDNRVRVVHQENRGVSAARNVGLSVATGKYIGSVDSDDWVDADMYKTLVEKMNAEQADIVICG